MMQHLPGGPREGLPDRGTSATSRWRAERSRRRPFPRFAILPGNAGRALRDKLRGFSATKPGRFLPFPGALPINHEVPRDGEEPSFKFRPAIILVSAFENADPSLLEKVLSALFVSRDVDEITE